MGHHVGLEAGQTTWPSQSDRQGWSLVSVKSSGWWAGLEHPGHTVFTEVRVKAWAPQTRYPDWGDVGLPLPSYIVFTGAVGRASFLVVFVSSSNYNKTPELSDLHTPATCYKFWALEISCSFVFPYWLISFYIFTHDESHIFVMAVCLPGSIVLEPSLHV